MLNKYSSHVVYSVYSSSILVEASTPDKSGYCSITYCCTRGFGVGGWVGSWDVGTILLYLFSSILGNLLKEMVFPKFVNILRRRTIDRRSFCCGEYQ